MKSLLKLLLLLTLTAAPAFARCDGVQYFNMPFWKSFNDEKLIENLLKVYENNNDLKSAVLRVNEAQRIVKMSFANELPYIGFDGYVGRIFQSSDKVFGNITIPNYSQTNYYLPLTMNYEIDIWGQNYLKTKSKKKQLEMIKQDERSAYIYISSAFAADYFNLIRCDKLIEYSKELVLLQQKVVNAYKIRYDLGTATLSEIEEAEKDLTFLQEDLHKLSEKQEMLKNQMSTLIADRGFDDIKRSNYDSLNVAFSTPESVDFDMLSQRPDRIKSELELERIGIDIKVAKRDMLPKFIITGNLGFSLFSLPSSHKFLSDLGVVPFWDLFTGGRKYQVLRIKKNQYDMAVQKYEKAILSSIQETNDALFSMKTAQNIKTITHNRLNADIKEFGYTKIKAEAGTADNLDLLLQEEKLLVSKQQALSSEINHIIAAINLYQALGGADFTDKL